MVVPLHFYKHAVYFATSPWSFYTDVALQFPLQRSCYISICSYLTLLFQWAMGLTTLSLYSLWGIIDDLSVVIIKCLFKANSVDIYL